MRTPRPQGHLSRTRPNSEHTVDYTGVSLSPQVVRETLQSSNGRMMAKARLMGYSTAPQGGKISDAERDAIKERRKREKANKKKNRKKR